MATGTLAYLLLLFQLSTAANGFAKYLAVAEHLGDETSSSDDEEGVGAARAALN